MSPPPTEPARVWVAAGIAFGVLNMPKLAAGVTLIAQIPLPLPLEISGVYWFDNVGQLSSSELDLGLNPLLLFPFPPEGSQITYNAAELKAAVCPLEQILPTGAVLLCGGVAGGAMFARPEGFLDEEDETRGLFSFEAYARFRFRFTHAIALTYSAGVFVPVIRDKFGYRDGFGDFQEEFRMPVLGGRLDFGLAIGF